MADRMKDILKKLLEIWNKYTSKQKTLIVSAVCIVVFAFALLIILMQRTDYEVLTTAKTTGDASSITKLLQAEGIDYKVGSDNLTISVDSTRLSDAIFLLADNNMPSTGLSIDDLLNNSLGTTNSDRILKLNLFFQNQLRSKIREMEGIDDAEVLYLPADNNNTILSEAKDTTASVFLKTNDEFELSSAETIAEAVAYVLGNTSAKSIRVIDQFGNLLYGGENDLYSGNASSNEDYKERLRNTYKNNIYIGLIKSGYDDAVIMPNLVFDMDKVTELYTEYIPAEGQEQGLLSHSYTYNSENAGSSGGIPGTDSNDETSYVTADSASSTGTVEIEENDYLPNERITNTEYEIGAVIPDQSSISIVLRKAPRYKEEELEEQGLLEDTTFEAYADANDGIRPIEVDDTLYTLVSNATGIAADRITITAFEQPVFIPAITTARSWTDYLQIILAVLIIGLLIFIVFKGIVPVEVTELEPELSVEQLLATTKENQSIDDIEFNEVSEVRRMIEKFVDEKPEAVAQLLRNWLNEDWN